MSWWKGQDLWEALDTYDMLDLGNTKPLFTWTNSRKGKAKIRE